MKGNHKKLVSDEKILLFMRTYYEAHRYSPSIREIMKATGLHSTAAVSFRLNKLQADGKIAKREKFTSRSYAVL